MKCVSCDNKKPLKKTTQTVKYTECGLENVVLKGVDYAKCDQCGEEYYGFGDQEQLHGLIADILIQKQDPLTGKELRFLRTYLGCSREYFSAFTTYDSATISRFENGHETSPKYDRLVRALVFSELPDRNYTLQDIFIEKKGKKFDRIEVASKKGHWQLAA